MRTNDGGQTWADQTTSVTPHRPGLLRAVSFADSNTGTTVGNFGVVSQGDRHPVILRTTDGGNSWANQQTATTVELNGVCLASLSAGTIVGDSGVILHTTDGGSTWTAQASATAKNLYAASFIDPDTGTVVGSNIAGTVQGVILKTTDGGATWVIQRDDINAILYGVSFVDANIGTAVRSNGTILRTTDGGTTWTGQTSGTNQRLRGVQLIDCQRRICRGRTSNWAGQNP